MADIIDDTPVEQPVLRRKKRVPTVETTAVSPELALIERIRNGEWNQVLVEVGSIEYNRLRLLALK